MAPRTGVPAGRRGACLGGRRARAGTRRTGQRPPRRSRRRPPGRRGQGGDPRHGPEGSKQSPGQASARHCTPAYAAETYAAGASAGDQCPPRAGARCALRPRAGARCAGGNRSGARRSRRCPGPTPSRSRACSLSVTQHSGPTSQRIHPGGPARSPETWFAGSTPGITRPTPGVGCRLRNRSRGGVSDRPWPPLPPGRAPWPPRPPRRRAPPPGPPLLPGHRARRHHCTRGARGAGLVTQQRTLGPAQ